MHGVYLTPVLFFLYYLLTAGIVQSVHRLTTGWTAEGQSSSPRKRKISHIHVVQTGSGAYTTSYPMGTGGSFPEGKGAGA
jgi:hypothetical protein